MPEDPRDPTRPAIGGAEREPQIRRVQVVARWNSWALVRDPEDGSEHWVDLERTDHARA